MAEKPEILDPNPHKPAARPPTETLYAETPVIGCDGSGGGQSPQLGHPMVYLNMEKEGRVDCPYCGRRFILKNR